MGTFTPFCHIYSMQTIINKNRKAEEMRKTFNNAKKIIEYRLEEERLTIKKAKEDMKKFDLGSDEYEHANIIYGSSLHWESCLEYLLDYDLTDFKVKYFEDFKKVQDDKK